MRSTFVYSILGGLGCVGAIVLAGCASSERTPTALFSDPGQFESLASGPHGNPRPVAVAEPADPKPSEANPVETPIVSAPAIPVAPVAAFDGGSLVSAPETVDSTKANRVAVLAAAAIETPVAPPVEAGALTPEDAYVAMLRGNERFVAGVTRGERRDETRRRSLASVQNPHTIVLSCSDSRVPPELIFDQGLGDLYTIRVSGNVLGSAQVASIETAVEKHGAKLIVVMGHESCETVQAALGQTKGASTDQAWLASEIRPHVLKHSGRGLASAGATPVALDPKLREPVMANVDAVTEQLLVRSRIVSGAVQSGKLRITRGIYSLESGRVDFWGTR